MPSAVTRNIRREGSFMCQMIPFDKTITAASNAPSTTARRNPGGDSIVVVLLLVRMRCHDDRVSMVTATPQQVLVRGKRQDKRGKRQEQSGRYGINVRRYACGMMYDGTIHTTYYLTCTYTGRNIGGLKSDRRAGWR